MTERKPLFPVDRAWWERLKRPSLASLVVVLGLAVVSSAGTGLLVKGLTPTYESSVTVELREPALFTEPGPGPLIKLNGLRLRYAALVKTDVIAIPVAERLGMTVDEVLTTLDVIRTNESLILRPVARTEDPELAKRIVGAVATELIAFVEAEQKAEAVPLAARIEMRIIEQPKDAAKVSPTATRVFLSAAVAGLLVFLAGFIVQQILLGRR